MPQRRRSHRVDLPHESEMELPDGRLLSDGVEFTLHGGGRFSFRYHFTPDGSVTAWGPVGSKVAQMRSFRPDQIKTIHRTPKG